MKFNTETGVTAGLNQLKLITMDKRKLMVLLIVAAIGHRKTEEQISELDKGLQPEINGLMKDGLVKIYGPNNNYIGLSESGKKLVEALQIVAKLTE